MLELDNVYCMDALEGLRELPVESVHAIITDPPYDVNYGEKSSFLAEMDKSREAQVDRDKHFVDKFSQHREFAVEWFRVLKEDAHVFIFCGSNQLADWITAMVSAGFKKPQLLTWIKNRTTFDMTMGYKFPENKEQILFFQKGWKKLNGYDVERHLFRSALFFDSNGDTEFHSCSKPMSLIMFLTKVCSQEGDVLLDCFAGSGNHLLAFSRLKRRFIGFEISREYYNIIVRRLEDDKKQLTLEVFGDDKV